MNFLNKENEPLRRYLYGALVAIAGVLVGYGLISDTELLSWTAVLQAVLLVPFVESARVRVRPRKDSGNDGSGTQDDSA